MFSKANYIAVRQAFLTKKSEAEAQAQARLDALHRAHPDLRQIDAALAATGPAIYREILKKGPDLSERLKKLQQENLELQQSRADCLRFYGYSDDYTDPHYECAICQDTGEDHGHLCICMKRALIMATYQSSGIGALLDRQTFDTFSLTYYTEGNSLVLAQNAYKVCRSFADHFPNGRIRNITLQGGTGLGKTHLSTAVAKVVIDRGFDVVYDTAQNILQQLEDAHFGRDENGETERFFTCDLLIIDDLGTEITTSHSISSLYNLLNSRINADRSTMVSTNLTSDELRRRYADRIYSRLFGEFTYLPMLGTDIRSQKLQSQPN